MTQTNTKIKRLLAQGADSSLGQLCNLSNRRSRFGMSSKLSDIGFRILTTSDFLFGFLSQLLLLILKAGCSTGDLLRNNPMPTLIFEVVLALTKTFVTRFQRCSVCAEMSNKIALVSLDFAGTGSMCGGNKGVAGDGCAISRNNNQGLPNRFAAGSIKPRE